MPTEMYSFELFVRHSYASFIVIRVQYGFDFEAGTRLLLSMRLMIVS